MASLLEKHHGIFRHISAEATSSNDDGGNHPQKKSGGDRTKKKAQTMQSGAPDCCVYEVHPPISLPS